MSLLLWPLAALGLWTLSGYSSSRASKLIGGPRANRTRLLLALPILVALALWSGAWPAATAMWWFVLAGVLHLGLSDWLLYLGYERMGARLALLVTLCLAAPVAAALEWWWLGTALDPTTVVLGLGIAGSVIVALGPRDLTAQAKLSGLLLVVGAAMLHAAGAVTTRVGFAHDHGASAWHATCLRVAGGLAVMLLVWAGERSHRALTGGQGRSADWRAARPWILTTTLLGPILGIGAYQQALKTVDAGTVQAIVSALPATVIPLTWLIDGDRPSVRSLVGSVLAVVLVAVLVLHRAGTL